MISIIIPVFNAEKYLGLCIESVLAQDYQDFELVLVNDGSTDSSEVVCRKYDDSRIKYICKENGGVSSARNKGLIVAEGDYIAFIDADDTIPRNALSKLFHALKDSSADMAIGSFNFQYGEKIKSHSSRLKPGCYKMQDLLGGFIDDGTLSGFLIGSVCGALYKKDIIKHYNIEFDPLVKNNEDGLFNFEYSLHSNRLAVVSDCVYIYRQNPDSSSSKRIQSYDYNQLIQERIKNLPWDMAYYNFDKQMKTRAVSLALWDILKYPRSMKLKEGLNYISGKVNSLEVREGIKYFSFEKLSLYKKVFAYLIKMRASFLMFIIVKYLIPILSSRIAR